MKRCITCEGVLDDSKYAGDSPICKICVSRLERDYSVDYSPPVRHTRRKACIALLLAIRRQAVVDDALDEWESYWLYEEPWKGLWELLIDTAHTGTLLKVAR